MLDRAPRWFISFCTENVELPINLLDVERAVPVAAVESASRAVFAVVACADLFIRQQLFHFQSSDALCFIAPGLFEMGVNPPR